MALEVELHRLTKAREWLDRDGPDAQGSGRGATGLSRAVDLVDDDSWFEIGGLARSQHLERESETPRDGLVTGFGQIAGQEVAVLSEDRRVLGRTDGQVAKSKLWKMVRLAIERQLPLIVLSDGPVSELADRFGDDGRLLGRMAPPSLLPESFEALPGIVVVKLGSGVWQESRELVMAADLTISVQCSAPTADGGAPVAADTADFVVHDETAAFGLARRVVDLTMSPSISRQYSSNEGRPEEDTPQDLTAILEALSDRDGSVAFEPYGGSVSGGLARLGGQTLAVLGPTAEAKETIELTDLLRIGRVARLCRRFGLPLLVVQAHSGYDPATYQTPAFLAAEAYGRQQIQQASAGRISLVIGKGHVLGRYILGGREIGYDLAFAWPWATIGVTDVPFLDAPHLDAARTDGPWLAAGLGLIEDVIRPDETRDRIGRILTIIHDGLSTQERLRPVTGRAH